MHMGLRKPHLAERLGLVRNVRGTCEGQAGMILWNISRSGFGPLAGALICMVALMASAVAETPKSPAKEAEKVEAPRGPETPVQEVGQQLFDAVARNLPQDIVAPKLRALVIAAGKTCSVPRDFQVFRRNNEAATVKLKCEAEPLYAVTTTISGSVQVAGGDGTVAEFQAGDGPIIPILGQRYQDYTTANQQSDAASNLIRQAQSSAEAESAANRATRPPVIGPVLQPEPPSTASSGLSAMTVFNIAAAGLVILALLKYLMSGSSSPSGISSDRMNGLNSRDKDLLLEQSEEYLPDIWKHPEGFFISKGRHGKRRFFRSAAFAYLYRDFGVRLRELR
jgi:hypothetical protein